MPGESAALAKASLSPPTPMAMRQKCWDKIHRPTCADASCAVPNLERDSPRPDAQIWIVAYSPIGLQGLSGLNSVIDFACSLVSLPRFLSYTTPLWSTMNVLMPVSSYFSG